MNSVPKKPLEENAFKILIVDDEEPFLDEFVEEAKQFNKSLENHSNTVSTKNIHVETSESFEDGLQKINSNLGKKFDLILVDQNLDKGRTGEELISKISDPLNIANAVLISFGTRLDENHPFLSKDMLQDESVAFFMLFNLIVMRKVAYPSVRDASISNYINSMRSIDLQLDDLTMHAERFAEIDDNIGIQHLAIRIRKLAKSLLLKRTEIIPDGLLVPEVDRPALESEHKVKEKELLLFYVGDMHELARETYINLIENIISDKTGIAATDDKISELVELIDVNFNSSKRSRWSVLWKTFLYLKKHQSKIHLPVMFLDSCIEHEVQHECYENVAKLEYSMAILLHNQHRHSASRDYFISAMENSQFSESNNLYNKIVTTVHSIVSKETKYERNILSDT